MQASVCEVTVELRKLSDDSRRSKVYKAVLESINAPVSKTLKLFPVTGKNGVKLEYRVDIKVRSYSQVPNKRVYSFIPNKKVGLSF